MFKKVIAFALAAVALVACTSKQKIEETEGPKVLVLYYSQTGATKTVAEEIQKQLAADIEAIEVTEPYDGDFNQTIERCQKEMAEGVTPELTPPQVEHRRIRHRLPWLSCMVWHIRSAYRNSREDSFVRRQEGRSFLYIR